MSPTAHPESTTVPANSTLLLALELSNKKWMVGTTVSGRCGKPRMKTLDASEPKQVGELLGAEIAAAKKRFKLPESAPVLSCYEAGRDGFWPHRLLESLGVKKKYSS